MTGHDERIFIKMSKKTQKTERGVAFLPHAVGNTYTIPEHPNTVPKKERKDIS